MLRRLPISLRFDDEESDFYFGFIEQKKNDRELSTLILNLLHVYYENDDVKRILDDYVLGKSPYMQIHAELERIALEHSKNTVSTGIMSDFTANERKKATEPPKAASSEEEGSKEEPKQLMSRQDITAEINNAVAIALKTLVDTGQIQVVNPTTSQQPIQQVVPQQVVQGVQKVEEFEKVVEPIIEKVDAPIVEEPIISEEKADVPVVEEPIIIEEIVESPVVEKVVVDNDSVQSFTLEIKKPTVSSDNSDNSVSVGEEVKEVKPKKPASFGKLLKSVQ